MWDGKGARGLTYASFLLLGGAASDIGEVLNDLFGVFSLTGSRLTTNQENVLNTWKSRLIDLIESIRDQHRLVLTIAQHVGVRVVGNRVQVRWGLSTLLASVEVYHLHGVDGQALVRVDGHAKETRVGLQFKTRYLNKRLDFKYRQRSYVDQPRLVTFSQVVQDAGVVQIGQVSHIVALLVLRRVHLMDIVFFYGEGLFVEI